MGQYYKPCILNKNKEEVLEFLYSHDYDNGLKLMEHSYLENNFVRTVEKLLSPGGEWYKLPLVWAGDYADPDIEGGDNFYMMCNLFENKKIKPDETPDDYKLGDFLVNHTKEQFFDKSKLEPKGGWAIHPLPLLTCVGNGRGGGDFSGKDPKNLVGTWARDIISVEANKPAGYNEIFFDFDEN